MTLKNKKGRRLPKFNGGLSPAQLAVKNASQSAVNAGLATGGAGGLSGLAGAAGGIAGATQLIGTTMQGLGGEPTSGLSKAGNILGSAGTFAQAGAALGPWGIAGGAVLGAGLGIIQNNKLQKEADIATATTSKNQTISNNMIANSAIASNFAQNNYQNDRLPGLNKGVAKFNSGRIGLSKPNALLAKGEVVKDGMSGELNQVPGQYDKSNPDTVHSNIPKGSSVYQKDPKYRIPGSKETPADIMARAGKVQKYSDKVLSGKVKGSKLDKDTAELNNYNIDMLSERLNMNTVLMNEVDPKKGMSKYNKGTISSEADIYSNVGLDEFSVTAPRINKAKTSGHLRSTAPASTIRYSKDNKQYISTSDIPTTFPEDWKMTENMSSPEAREKFILQKYQGVVRDGESIENPLSNSAVSLPRYNDGKTPSDEMDQYFDKIGAINRATFESSYAGKDGYVYDEGRGDVGTIYRRTDKPTEYKNMHKMYDNRGKRISTSQAPSPTPANAPQSLQEARSPQQATVVSPEINNAATSPAGGLNVDYNTQGNWSQDQDNPAWRMEGTPASKEDFQTAALMGAQSPFLVTLAKDGKTWVKVARNAHNNQQVSKEAPLNEYVPDSIKNIKMGTQPAPLSGDASLASKQIPLLSNDTPQMPFKAPQSPVARQSSAPGTDTDAGNQSGLDEPKIGQTYENTLVNRGGLGSISDGLTDLMSLAPVAYNLFNSTPEIMSPRHGSYINPNQRYNMAPHVAASLKQRQIARYNQSAAGAGSGASIATGGNLYSKGIEQKSKIFDLASKFNTESKERYAERFNKIASDVVSEERRVEDVNMRSKAAAQNMKATGLSQLSKYAQNKQLMKNQAASDVLSSKAWEAMASTTDQATRERLLAMMSNITKTGGTKILESKSSKNKKTSTRNGG